MAAQHSVWLINGPNLNLTGYRQPEIYGARTLPEIDEDAREFAKSLGIALTCKQSNHEGTLIDWLHEARSSANGVILNAGGYSHTSVALADAVGAFDGPTIELHLSNIHARETFRQHSMISRVAVGLICGFGADGYRLAISAMQTILNKSQGQDP